MRKSYFILINISNTVQNFKYFSIAKVHFTAFIEIVLALNFAFFNINTLFSILYLVDNKFGFHDILILRLSNC